ncbi:MAG: hypothetical protein LBJ94_00885 [Puniceicoccales bacterium]|nr:hypothetical protein [Puniceicoccales bacterium]
MRVSEEKRVDENLNRPEFGNVSNSWLGRRFCSRADASAHLDDFNRAIDYLNNKFGDSIPELRKQLVEQQDYYQSNKRGIGGRGGRLRAFTDSDLKKLEREAENEMFRNSLNPMQQSLLEKIGINVKNVGMPRNVSPAQAKCIAQHCESMVAHGYKEEYAVKVGQSMAILYVNDIENKGFLPKIVSINQTVLSEAEVQRRANAKSFLGKIMSNNGANYEIMANYFYGQQNDSWSSESQHMKAFLLQQRADTAQNARYFLGRYTEQSLLNAFNGDVPDRETYANTIAMYDAFTAITLEHLDTIESNPSTRLSKENRTVELRRGIRSEHAHATQEGIADSTSLGRPSHRFTGPGFTVLKYTVPFCDVHTLFFMSPELCWDGDWEEKLNLGEEHEVVCDMSHCSEADGTKELTGRNG